MIYQPETVIFLSLRSISLSSFGKLILAGTFLASLIASFPGLALGSPNSSVIISSAGLSNQYEAGEVKEGRGFVTHYKVNDKLGQELKELEEKSKVTICHLTGSPKNPRVDLEVSTSALKAHLVHGDRTGSCDGSNLTAVPTYTATNTSIPTLVSTQIPTLAPADIPTQVPTIVPTSTFTSTATPTATFTATPTATQTPTHTATQTPTHTATQTPTHTATMTPTPRGLGTFKFKTSFYSPSRPYGAAILDLDKDGNNDLVIANQSSNDLSIFIGKGDGTFNTITKVLAGVGPYSLISADFNLDSNMDLAVANNGSSSVDIFFGDGAGGLILSNSYSVGSQPTQIELSDINGDGLKDIIVANFNSNFISTLVAQSNGQFSNNLSVGIGQSGFNSYSYGITSGDFSQDSQIDIAAVNSAGLIRGAAVLIQEEVGASFAPQALYSTQVQPIDIEAADFDSDGKQDLVVSNYGANSVTLLKGSGDGTFINGRDFVTGSYPMVIKTADINGDNKMDLLVANHVGGDISVLLGDGEGNLNKIGSYSVNRNPYDFAIGDLNNDGALDFVATSYITNIVTVYLQNK